VLPSGIALLVLLALTCWALYKWPGIGFLAAGFFIALGPTSSLLPIADLAVEHRMYVPLASLTVLAVLGGSLVIEFAGKEFALPPSKQAGLAVGTVGVMSVALCVATVARNEDYYSEMAMWEKVVALRPDNPRARYNLALHLSRRNDFAGALDQCLRVLTRDPEHAEAHSLLGRMLILTGQTDAGTRHVEAAVKLKPKSANLRCVLGKTLLDQGKLDDAAEQYRAALSLVPTLAVAHNGLGLTFAGRGLDTEALPHFAKAISLRPEYAEAYTNMAICCRHLKRFDEALRYHKSTIQLRPDSTEALSQAGLTLLSWGRPREAAECFDKAVSLAPDKPRFHRELAEALYEMGHKDAALSEYRRLSQVAPEWIAATTKDAWKAATSSDRRLRDPQLALIWAMQVCQATAFLDPKCLDALAAAYAASGDFQQASKTATTAIKIAEPRDPTFAGLIRKRAAQYDKGEALSE
jgi:tetratricopeptide (TPR) repeat protein